jgi:hypothetical protein
MREGAGVADSSVSSSAVHGPSSGELERPLLRILDLDEAMHAEGLGPKARARRIRAELGMSALLFYHQRWTALSTAYCWVERPKVMQRLTTEQRQIRAERQRLIEEVRRVG